MATQIVPAPVRADHHHLTAPLPWPASDAITRVELALADRTVANFDNHGSLWGFDTVEDAEASIAKARAAGTDVDEWETTDREGKPLRVVRMADPTFLDTICVFSAWRRELWAEW
ncbi:hypothetical protein [Streptomyces sp. NPDC020377]|uniref:hypothetical protein n=1 Tax=Streptomyces sp. NPDC020377 TaxID=3365070 RepID=UPI00379746CA